MAKNKNKRLQGDKSKKHRIDTSQSKKTKKNKIILSLAGIVVLTLIVFFRTSDYGILNWDDNRYLYDNEVLQELSSENVKTIFSSFYFGNYHPLTTITYAVEHSLFGFNPKPYHVTNIIFHLLNVILVFYFIYLLIGRIDLASIVALFFAVHPMHVESVAWISERKDVLYSFFFLAALISYFYYLSKGRKLKYLIISFILFILSLLSKSAAVTLPLIMLLMDYYLKRKYTHSIIIEKIPFIMLSVLFGVLAMLSQNIEDAEMVIANFNWLDRIFLVSYSIMFYIVKAFIPINLSAIHYYPIKSGAALPFEFYLAPLGILMIIFLIYKSKAFKRELIFGSLFFLFTIFIVLQIIPIGRAIVSERYTYIPYIGIFFIISQFYYYVHSGKFSFSSKVKSYITYAIIAYALIFSLVSWNRVEVWENGVKLFSDVIKKYPDRYYGYWSRGNSFKDESKFKEAINDYTQVIRLKPDYYEAYTNRGLIKDYMQDYEEAIKDYERAIKLKPENAEAYNNRGLVYSKMSKFEKAIADYNKAINLDSSYYIVYYNRGLAKHNLRRYKDAIVDYDLSLKLKPKQHNVLLSKGLAHFALNEFEDAEKSYSKAIEINPDFAEAYNYRGVANVRLENVQKAIEDFTKAITIDPDYSEAYFNRGLTQIQTGNSNGACYDWNKASQLGNKQAGELLNKYCR